MTGCITIEDGRTVWLANWATDVLVQSIAEAIPQEPEASAFREWLLDQRKQVRGYCDIDVRELTPRNQQLFWEAAERALKRSEEAGGADWHDPSFFPGWLERCRVLLKLRESYLRGDDPNSFNPHSNGLVPPTNEKSGPGW